MAGTWAGSCAELYLFGEGGIRSKLEGASSGSRGRVIWGWKDQGTKLP